MSFERITDQQEQRLKVAWLRKKRLRTREEFAAHHDASKEAQLPVDSPDYTDSKQMPFGFGNTLMIQATTKWRPHDLDSSQIAS